jgi:hypothetical protein
MKIKSTLLMALIASAGLANGAIYTFNNVALGPGDTLYANSASQLSLGTIVTAGVFTAGFDLNANLGNKTALLAAFTILSSVTAGSPSDSFGSLDPLPGYTEYLPNDLPSIVTGNALIGRTLYSFNGNAANLNDSTQFSLFQVATIADDTASENEYVINPAGITPIIGTPGTFNGNAGGGAGVYNTLNTAALIPEPSAALLGAIGALGLLRRRRI